MSQQFTSGSQTQAALMYKSVINDVVNNVKEAFLDEGVDETILNELRTAWEERIRTSKAVDLDGTVSSKPQTQAGTHRSPQIVRSQPTQPHTSAPSTQPSRGAMLAQAVLPTQHTVIQHGAYIQGAISTGGLSLPTVPEGSMQIRLPPELALLMQQQQQRNNQQMGGKNVPQLDGQCDGLGEEPTTSKGNKFAKPTCVHSNKTNKEVVQLDGAGGVSEDEDEIEEDEEIPDNNEIAVQEGEPLNSDDDGDSDEEGDAMFDADDVIICQYEKVSRVRTKWKIVLKDGIMHVDGRDYAFQKATGEAEW